ncbi:MAG: GIY-YIG nuclease family protein [bacterium]
MNSRSYHVYIMTNYTNTTLYTGMTGNLAARVYQHKNKEVPGFTSRYNINKLVYIEEYDNPYDAITREKQIKAGSRKKKIELIECDNPDWEDLSFDL